MAYQLRCDGFILDDPRDDALSVQNPVVNLEVNTPGTCSFTIHKNHPYYDKLKKLKSVFEVSDDIGVIFRGRMLDDAADFYNSKSVNLEGVLAYFNDSIVRPYSFPEDFIGNAEYETAAASGNVIAFFLKWLIENHNAQTQPFQHFKLGNVTVTDPNNYLTRSNSAHASTWETLKGKLFNSALGGKLCIRYEADGNYIDYLSEFTLTNTQEIVFGQNLLDITSKTDASMTYSAMIPIGADIEEQSTDADGQVTTTKHTVTISDLPDGDITDDIVKSGDTIYSKKAVEAYGWIYAPISDTTWNDVTEAANLRTKAVNALQGDLVLMTNTVEISFVDLHFTDKQIQTFRMYRNVKVRSAPHGHSGTYELPKLSLDLHKPENGKATVGKTERSLLDINSDKESSTIERIESAEKDIEENRSQTNEVANQVVRQSTQMYNTADEVVQKALAEYVKTSNYEEFKKTLESELTVWAGGISGRVSATETSIQDVNGDLQKKINEITKYFTFDINGLLIGALDANGNPSKNKIVIDNDEITIYASNVPVQEFKADGTALIPTLKITKSLNVVGLRISESETHIDCDYIVG
jgi:hypothetical protein